MFSGLLLIAFLILTVIYVYVMTDRPVSERRLLEPAEAAEFMAISECHKAKATQHILDNTGLYAYNLAIIKSRCEAEEKAHNYLILIDKASSLEL